MPVDDKVAFLAFAVFVDHAVNVRHPGMNAVQVPGSSEIDSIYDGDPILEMILVDHADPPNRVRLRAQVGDQFFVFDSPKRQDGRTVKTSVLKSGFDRDGVDDESVSFPVAD